MALIKCSECGNQVSSSAASCPKCGTPIASEGIRTPLATIQRTSKTLKMQGCLGGVLFCIGVGVLVYGISTGTGMVVGIALTLIGIVWSLITRIRIWWHHE